MNQPHCCVNTSVSATRSFSANVLSIILNLAIATHCLGQWLVLISRPGFPLPNSRISLLMFILLGCLFLFKSKINLGRSQAILLRFRLVFQWHWFYGGLLWPCIPLLMTLLSLYGMDFGRRMEQSLSHCRVLLSRVVRVRICRPSSPEIGAELGIRILGAILVLKSRCAISHVGLRQSFQLFFL